MVEYNNSVDNTNGIQPLRTNSGPPRSLDDFLENAAAATTTPITSKTSSLISVCTELFYCCKRRKHPPLRNSVFLRYSSPDRNTDSSVSSNPTTNTTNSDVQGASSTATCTSIPWRYWLIYLSIGIANSSDASEILCLSYILSIPQFETNILHHTAWRAGMLAATVFMGMLIGGIVVGPASDTFGRQPLLVVGLAVNSIAGLISAAATNVYILTACRFIAGLGIGATVPPLFALCSELAPPSSRGFWVTFVASFWMVGSMFVAIIGWIILGQDNHSSINDDVVDGVSWWRIFTACCAIPSCLGCVMVHKFVPESPRFLLLQGRHKDALTIANNLARYMQYTGPILTIEDLLFQYPIDDREGSRQQPSAGLVVQPMSIESLPDKSHFQDVSVRRRSRLVHRSSSFMHSVSNNFVRSSIAGFFFSISKLYATSKMRSTTWPLQVVWFTLSFGSYGLMTWINKLFVEAHLENIYFNALLFSASNLPGNIISAILMDQIGRSNLLTGSILASSLSLVAFAYVASQQSSNSSDGTDDESKHVLSTSWIVLAACSFQCFSIASWNTIDVLSSELFPTSVRSTGMGLCAATGRIGAMMAQFVNGALVSKPVRLLLVAASALFVGAITPIFLPTDQTGRPVQDYIQDCTEVDHIHLSRLVHDNYDNHNRVGYDESEPNQQEDDDDLDGTESKLPTKGSHDYSRVPQSIVSSTV